MSDPEPLSATVLARSLVRSLVAAGTRHAVLCPGSRNAPLAFALHDAAEAGDLVLHTRIDERTAAFLALGIARASQRPTPVVTTSGTASANLHPAVLEAAHAGVPLVAITADRPARLRGTNANQTTDQTRLFGEAAEHVDVHDAASYAEADLVLQRAAAGEALGPAMAQGPVHLNVQLDVPLVPTGPGVALHLPERLGTPTPALDPHVLAPGPRTVVVAGDDAGRWARQLAQAGDWPLLAEPSSGSRNGTHALRCYRLLLSGALAAEVERVVVLGHPTLSRPVTDLLLRENVEVVSVRPPGRWARRPHPVSSEHDAVAAKGPDEPAWRERWRAADELVAGRLDALLAAEKGLTPYDVAAAVNAALPPDGLLHVGASSPARDLDLMARPYPVGEHHRVLANRGLAGIDGTLSSAIGEALARRRTARAIAYVGDVTFLHDANALVIGPDEEVPDLTVVVANDDGGSIFATLEQGAPEHAASFEKLFGTPHGVDLAALCAATRTPHWRVHDRAELDHALASPNGGLEVVEAVVPRDTRRALDARIRALAPR